MRKILFIISFIFLSTSLFADNPKKEKVNIYFFHSTNCYHCKKEKIFLEKIKKKQPEVKIYYLESSRNKKNKALFRNLVNKLKIDVVGFPLTVVGTKYFIGFADEETTGKSIENAIIYAKKYKSKDLIEQLQEENGEKKLANKKAQMPRKVKVLFFGEIDVKDLSLPLLTIVLGAIDGFNPCSMWALVMLISFLIALQNKKKMLLLGSIFIFVSAAMYFLFMVAWLNFLLFFSYVFFIKISIGIAAIIGGAYYLKEFFFNKEQTCKVTSSKMKKNISTKMSSLTQNNKIFFAILGIIVLAFAVNLVDLICSAGLPVIYTQVLSLSALTTSQYYLYVLLYVFIFMLDDLIIFFIAIFSLHLIGLTNSYKRFSKLLGGIVLLVIGLLLIFKPDLLMF